MQDRQGFTLMELLVVLLIIGILSTVALRTIDATRDRSLFDQTSEEMNQLVQAITGNPDMTYDGRRVDFGFYGDMGKLPDDLRELVYNPGDSNWHGPYVRQTVGGDTAGYLLDGWGNRYTYDPTRGTIASLGNGKFPMTVRVADSLVELYTNTISGTITDADDNPPGEKAANISITFDYGNGLTRSKSPDPGGFYQFSTATNDTIPVGLRRLFAVMTGGETLTRWVTVAPRSKTIVDFRFSKSFRNQLKMVGAPTCTIDTAGFSITVVNDGTSEVTVDWILFSQSPDSAYMRTFAINGTNWGGFPLPAGQPGIGKGDTVHLSPAFVFQPNMSEQVDLMFQEFRTDILGDSGLSYIHGKTFNFRFSDGSEITAKP